jgi:hypothetical protein
MSDSLADTIPIPRGPRKVADNSDDMVAIATMLKAMEGMQAQSQQLTDLLLDLTKRVGLLERANKTKLISVRS